MIQDSLGRLQLSRRGGQRGCAGLHLQLMLCLACLWSASRAASSDFGSGLSSAVQNYGLSELVAAAKRSDPDSSIPYAIEHLLTGLSMATDPTSTMEGVYPGALAASAISQLIEMHGKDIANMTYRDRKVFIGGAYGDPSLIPDAGSARESDRAEALCWEMFEVENGGYAECKSYVAHIHRCNANKAPTEIEIKHCNDYLSEFYEHMQYAGKSRLVREAGAIASREFVTVMRGGGVPSSLDLSGTWICKERCPSGGEGRTAKIEKTDQGLTFTNEGGGTSRGHFEDTDTVVAEQWGNLAGDVRNGGEAIHWHNGTVWVRDHSRVDGSDSSGRASSPPRDPGCLDPPQAMSPIQAAIHKGRSIYGPSRECLTPAEAAERKKNDKNLWELNATKEPCTKCPKGYSRKRHRGVDSCVRCPEGKSYDSSDECCR